MNVRGLVVAAGSGIRAGLDMPKQFSMLGGSSVLSQALNALLDHQKVAGCIAVVSPDHEQMFRRVVEPELRKPVELVHGGSTRLQSVRLGLEALLTVSPTHVLIHDGARPFLPESLIDDIVAKFDAHDAVIPVLPVTDALWQVNSGYLDGSFERTDKCRAQTPQGFAFKPILEAYRNFSGDAADDAAVALKFGMRLKSVAGSVRNLKITYPDDMSLCEDLISRKGETRTGFGYDVHRLESGDGVILCGVKIPFNRSLKGHSDADVATHALADAIYGGLADGDIGKWFPPDDQQWRAADSMIFLKHAAERATKLGYSISGVDCTIVCEEPKIAPHSKSMRERIATCLEIPIALIGIKATTSEGLGFTGRGEGIAAHAVATLTKI